MERAILVVEDNEDDVDLTLLALNKSHLSNDLVIARDGQEAMDFLDASERAGTLPVLILLDLRLPKIDGLEVLRRIRDNERTRRLPVRRADDLAMGDLEVRELREAAASDDRDHLAFRA